MRAGRQRYSESLKRQLVARLCSPGGPSAAALSREVGIGQPTLSRWVKEFGNVGGMKNDRLPHSPDDWTLADKQQAVCSFYKQPASERGTYLRSQGLKSGDIERFEREVQEALSTLSSAGGRGRGRPAKAPEVKRLEGELKATKRELHRKDKALAETAARVVLLKKSQLLFGLGDEENE